MMSNLLSEPAPVRPHSLSDGADALNGQVDPHPRVQQIQQDFHTVKQEHLS